MLRTAGKRACRATLGQLLGIQPPPIPPPPPRSLPSLRQAIAGPSSRPYCRPLADNADEVFDQPSLEYAKYSRDPDEPAEAFTRSAKQPPRFTPAQLTLYHALRQLTFGSRRKRSKRNQIIKPSQVYRWTLWTVEQKPEVSSQSKDVAAASLKGKGKQREVTSQAPTHELSAPSWGLLLRYAVQEGDHETFAAMVEGFLDWRKRLVLEKMTHEKDQQSQSQSDFFSHNATAEDAAARSRGTATESRTLHESGQGSETVQTIAQVISLARTLASKLDNTQSLSSPSGVAVPQLLKDAAHRPSQDAGSNPYHLTATLRGKVPIPPAPPTTVAADDAADTAPRPQGRPKHLRWLSSLKKPEEKRQVKEFMELLSEASTEELTAETLALEMKRRAEAIRALDTSTPEAASSGGRKSKAAPSEAEASQQTSPAQPAKPFTFDLLGSPTDPKSISSILLRKTRLRQWLFSDRRQQDQEPSSSLDADGPLLASSSAQGTPHTWLFLLYARSLSERGATAKLREVLELYLSAWYEQKTNVPSLEIFEAEPTRKQRKTLTKARFFPNPYAVFAISEPTREPRGCDLLNYLLRSRVGRCLDEQTSQEEFQQGWKDCLDLCTESASSVIGSTQDDPPSTMTQGSKRLPLVTPDETTILLLLDLLRHDPDRLSKGFNLIEECERSWSPPIRLKTVETRPYMYLTIRTSRILLSWAREAQDAEAAEKAVHLAKKWRTQELIRSKVKANMAWHRKSKKRSSAPGISSTASASPDASSSSDGTDETIGRSRRLRPEYSTLRRPGRAWFLWKRAVGRARAKNLLKPPRTQGQKDVDEAGQEKAETVTQYHEGQENTRP